MTGPNRKRPGLEQALAAVREGDTLVAPKLNRLARSVPDARAIGDSLAARGVRLSLGGSVYDPNDPMGKMFFNILATVAEFEVDLLRMRTREGMAIARANGKLKGKAPKLSHRQRAHLLKLHKSSPREPKADEDGLGARRKRTAKRSANASHGVHRPTPPNSGRPAADALRARRWIRLREVRSVGWPPPQAGWRRPISSRGGTGRSRGG